MATRKRRQNTPNAPRPILSHKVRGKVSRIHAPATMKNEVPVDAIAATTHVQAPPRPRMSWKAARNRQVAD